MGWRTGGERRADKPAARAHVDAVAHTGAAGSGGRRGGAVADTGLHASAAARRRAARPVAPRRPAAVHCARKTERYFERSADSK